MNDKRNALDMFRSNAWNLFEQGLFSDYPEEPLWNALGFGGMKADVREKEDAYIIDAEMPGMDKDDVVIDITDRTLTISVKMDEQSEQKDEEGRYLRRERRQGAFRRSFSLENVKADEIKAEMKNGVLSIYCPKKAKTMPNSRRIDID